MAGIHGAQESSGLFDGDFRGLALDDLVALATNGSGRVKCHGVAHDQSIEEMANGGKVDLFG